MIIYKDIDPVQVENTVMTAVIRDGVHMVTRILPLPGFVLHDKAGDWEEPDTRKKVEAFYTGSCSCEAGYDFEENPRRFYVVKRETVPEAQVFN